MSARERFDAVAVGAGPAGSMAALALARAGARVALVDKSAFPRDKACGDLIGPRGVGVLGEEGITLPGAGRGAGLRAVGPSGRSSRLPAFQGRTYPGHGLVLPRRCLDRILRDSAIAAGAVPVQARVSALDQAADGTVRAVLTGDGRRFQAGTVIGADGALSTVARLAGMDGRDGSLWGFAVRAYVPAEVGVPVLTLLDAEPWRIYPGYGWLFPGVGGQANVGIGVGLGATRRRAPLRADLDRFCALLRERGELGRDARPGPVTGGWLRMGGAGVRAASANVLLVGDAAGLINPLQGEGIGAAMISGRLASRAVISAPGQAGGAYVAALAQAFGGYLPGAAALQRTLLRHPAATSAGARLLTAPVVRTVTAATWSLYWNGLADGAEVRPSAWLARVMQSTVTRLAERAPGTRK